MYSFQHEVFKKKLSQKGVTQKIRIVSDSMHPVIKINEVLDVERIEIHQLKRFDIILVNYFGTPYCHFFWNFLNENEIVTKSYKHPEKYDLPIKNEHIIGIIKNK